MNEQIAIYGIKFACKKLNILEPVIEFYENFESHQHITSMYLPESNTIIFNRKWVDEAEISEVLLVSFHESRHAYQKRQIDLLNSGMNYDEVKKNICIWDTEFKCYSQPKSDGIDIEYLNQEIEKDAVDFSNRLLNEINDK